MLKLMSHERISANKEDLDQMPQNLALEQGLHCFHLIITFVNQRTSGPVNAHLTPGPGIYFNAFIHVYCPMAGTANPLGTRF